MCLNTVRQDAIIRCRDAYQSNGIAWDPALEGLAISTLLENAEYWEEKAKTKPDAPIYDLLSSPRKLNDRISRIAGFPKHRCSSGGRTPRQRPRRLKRPVARGSAIVSPCGDGGMIG